MSTNEVLFKEKDAYSRPDSGSKSVGRERQYRQCVYHGPSHVEVRFRERPLVDDWDGRTTEVGVVVEKGPKNDLVG